MTDNSGPFGDGSETENENTTSGEGAGDDKPDASTKAKTAAPKRAAAKNAAPKNAAPKKPTASKDAPVPMATVEQVTLPPGEQATHQARSGKSYTLVAGELTRMPLEDAYTFLVDPVAFEVRDEEGNLITPPSTKQVDGGRIELADNEVIANLDELSTESLLKRTKRHAGADTFNMDTPREEMMLFLIEVRREIVTKQGGRGSEMVIGEMDRKTLDNLLDLSDALA